MSTSQITDHPDAQVVILHPDTGPAEPAPEPPPELPPAAVAEPGTRRPVIPEPWQKHNRRATIDHHVGLLHHRAKYHSIRLPWYGVRFAGYAVRGAHRLGRSVLDWWHWPEGWLLESQAVARGSAGHHDAMAAHKQGLHTRARRGRIVFACGFLALVVLALMLLVLPWYGWLLALAAAAVALIRHGRPSGKPLVDRAVVPQRYEAPTPEVIMRALGSLGIGLLAKAVQDGADMIRTPVHRDGPGWGVRLELPHGVTAVQVINERERLASALRRPLSATWPAPVPHEHPGMLDLWIGFTALNKQAPVAWPLAKAGKADLFAPVPFGADQRGNVVTLTLMFASVLIGAMPRMGKTMALRILALACALAPNARLRVWELKGTGDLAALKHVAHEYGSGADQDTLDACLASVRAYHRELDIRAKTLRELPDEVRPENKVTPELAADRKLGLYPDVLIIDEVQEAFTDPARKAEFEFLLTAITKRGPALGMILMLATQRPDAKSLPTGVSANIMIRFCLKVMGYLASNMVLGDGMSTAGYDASDFVRSDKGIGWLTGEADDPQIVRTCYIDAPAADLIARRARAARLAAGTLSGFALDEDSGDESRDFLADVLAVFGTDEKLWCETIAARLMEHIPEGYDLLTKEAVASQLRAAGVTVKGVREKGRPNRAGCERSAVAAVAGETGQL